MNNITRIVAVCVLTCLPGTARAVTIHWTPSLKDAETKAVASGKRIWLYACADKSEMCKRFDKEAMLDSRVLLLLQDFVPCAVDVGKEGKGGHLELTPDGKTLMDTYHISKVPFEAILDSTGKLITSDPDFVDSDKFLAMELAAIPPATISAMAANHTDADALEQTVVIEIAHGDLAGAQATMEILSPIAQSADRHIPAANHAMASAYVNAKQYDKAVPFIESAIADLPETHEAVTLHFMLAECDAALGRNLSAGFELEMITGMDAATKEEKKLAKTGIKPQ